MAGRPRQDHRGPHRRGKPEIPWPSAKRPAPDRETIRSLQERAKELTCLYRVDEVLARQAATLDEVFADIIAVIPPGWKYPAACQARIVWDGRSFSSPGYIETEWRLTAPLYRDQAQRGAIEVSYTAAMAEEDTGPFLNEEVRLIHAIAERLSIFLRQTEPESAAG